jgi:hypothetical protein
VIAAFDAYQVLMGYVLNHIHRAERGATPSRLDRYAELAEGEEDLPLTAQVARVLPAGDEERFLGGLRIVIGGIARDH